jgi:hypothetical protein
MGGVVIRVEGFMECAEGGVKSGGVRARIVCRNGIGH